MGRYRVSWTSQSQGCEKTKFGEVIAIIPANGNGYAFLPAGMLRKSHVKFQKESIYKRVLVCVKAGANKNINHYYAPPWSMLERQGNAEVLKKFVGE